jgi:heparan-alpha-glucosaminide N-acetyltransferase
MSIDALRGLVMFMMIYVNDLAGAGKIVPDWMVHFSDRHRTGSGMTFVDLVFPAFLFIVGMSIPFALGARLSKGDPLWKILRHIVVRTIALLCIGVLMVNESPDSVMMGWSAALWSTLMFISALGAFCDFAPGGRSASTSGRWRIVSTGLRVLGLVSLGWLALAFVGPDGHRILTLSPFALQTEWWGILGLIGWAYLVGSLVFLICRGNRTALLGCMVLLLCLYPADQAGAFNGLWLAAHVGIGGTLGSQAAITVGGLLLATILVAADTITVSVRVRFTLWFIAGTAAGAWLLNGLYGISKNSATPSWCLWACAITAALWLMLYFIADVRPVGFIARPLAVAGQNVLLAYLLSEMLPSALDLFQLGGWYGRLAGPELFSAVARSAGCGFVILCATAALNRVGFRLKL